jgi:apolipoprotein N-acyltransferase
MTAEGKAGSADSRRFSISPRLAFVLAFALGAVTVAGYAPFDLYLLPVITVAGLCYLWHGARTARAAAKTGYAFGLGWFLFGVSWVYVSLHDFGAMPVPLAAVATLLFCAFLALFPAAVGYACGRWITAPAVRYGLLVPAAWTLAEWTRGWIFTGFPWLALGYSQVPHSPLAGYAPVLGIHGVTLATTATAGLLAAWWLNASDRSSLGHPALRAGTDQTLPHPSSLVRRCALQVSPFILFALWIGGWGLEQVEWTRPVGSPVTVTLLQGNIPQDLKWREDRVQTTLKTYSALAWTSSSRLIILPETALPLFLEDVPKDYLSGLAEHARRNGGDILVGVPERLANGDYFNSVVSFGAAATQTYRKSHLVPFGEFIPLRPLLEWIVVGIFRVPLQDFSRGAEDQRPLEVAGQRVAVNICYEDAFGEEIIRQLPEATLLVNVSNVAWFGRSIAPSQHLQISQARALETGRYMLRATNTGVTAVIGPDGRILDGAPEFKMTTVTHAVQGYEGATPYVRMGNSAALALCTLLLAAFAWMRRRSARSFS